MHSHLSLEGEYKVSVYERDGALRYSLGPFKNFITSTGLSYPTKYAFADCFRYLSLGTSDTKNTIVKTVNKGWGTTALTLPHKTYAYIGGRTEQYDTDHATTQYSSASYKEMTSGVSLSRSWRIPAGAANYFTEDITFKEVMLSPGRPYVTGISSTSIASDIGYPVQPEYLTALTITDADESWTVNQFSTTPHYVQLVDDIDMTIQQRLIASNTSTVITIIPPPFSLNSEHTYSYFVYPIYKLCHCSETNGEAQGADYAAIASFYNSFTNIFSQVSPICEATGAFVRVVKDMPVTKDNYMVFDYTLYVNAETGRVNFVIVVENDRGVKQNDNWHAHDVTGCHNLIHHGVKLINPGVIAGMTPFGPMTQISEFYENYDYGESFIGPWGSPLEPSTPREYLNAYLTSDNLQFYANAKDGGAYVAGVPGFASQSGLMLWRSTPIADTSANFDVRHYNIRKPANVDSALSVPQWPLPTNYTEETYTPEDFGHTPFYLENWTSPAVTPVAFSDPSVRSRSITRSFEFATLSPAASSFIGQPIRGIVLNYIDASSYSVYNLPYLDCLFTDSGAARTWDGGKWIIAKDSLQSPQIIPTGYPAKTSYGTGSYSYWYYLEGGDTDDTKLTLSFAETWSSPCDASVDGC